MSEISARSEVTVPLEWISQALDEIWRLRRLCAYEAGVREADLGYATYPKSRRRVAENRIEVLRQAARGEVEVALASVRNDALNAAMAEAGASSLLTRVQWESEKPALQGRR